jgi:hypothetical protein
MKNALSLDTTFRFSEGMLWNRNDFMRFRFLFRLWKSFGSGSGSGSGSRQYLAQFSKNKKIAQKLAFSEAF